MTPADIVALRGLCERATPGPWKPNVWIETDGDEWRATGPGHDRHAHDYGSEPGGPDEQAAQADAAFIAAARSALPALLDRVEELERERDEARNRVLRPLTEREVQAALHEGRAEAMAATGDNAWTSLLTARDKLAAECERLRALVNRAADSLDYCVQRHGEHSKSVRGDELRLAAIASEGGVK